MATSTSIAGTSYNSVEGSYGAGATSPTAGVYTALAPYGDPPQEGSAEYEEIPVSYLGVDGVGTKQGGFRGRNLTIDMVIIGATKSACMSSHATLLATMPTTSRFSVTVPGGTARPGCKLLRGSGKITKWETLDNKIVALLTLEIRQMSLTS